MSGAGHDKLETRFKLRDSKRRRSLVKHGMAVGADGNQVSLWVNSVTGANVTEWYRMMNVDKATAQLTVAHTKIEATYSTSSAKVSEAGPSSCDITLIGIDRDAPQCALPKALGSGNLVSKDNGRVTTLGEKRTPKFLKLRSGIGRNRNAAGLRLPVNFSECARIEAGTWQNRFLIWVEQNIEANGDVEC